MITLLFATYEGGRSGRHCVELNCEIRKIDSDVEDKMHDIEYNSPNRRKIAKARNLFNSPAKLIEISSKYEVLNSEEINETIEVNDNSDNSKQAAEEPGKVEKSKINPIMLKYVKNYVDILDVIRTTCGPTENKFGNGYIKIFTISIEQYQKVQSTLKVQGFDYYLFRPIDKRPLKVVIKDLPLDHDTDVIKNCLKKHGFVICKVTQFRTRQPLPFFLVEVGKSEISIKPEEIFKFKNLNHLSTTVYPYRGRKKTIQCFKCNRFNHTAELCSMTPRCLKCGQSHTTIECEIKQRIEKPICINCDQVGHVAAYRGCAEFPKLTTAHKNRNNNFDSNKYLVNSNISYAQKANGTSANTLDSEQQMAPPAHRPANNVNNQSAAFASTCIERNVNNTPIPAISGNNDLSVLMTALKELRKLMKEAPQLIAALQAMKYANNTADKLQLLMNACASSAFLDDPANQHPQHPSGGTAILIRNNIPHNQIIPPNLRYVEACVVAINFKNQDPITLTSIYVPPTSGTSIFTFDIEVLLQISPNQILCGDYNAHHTSWGCNYDCPRGNSIKAFALQAGLEILVPSTPTRFGTNSANTIDFAIVKNFLYTYEIHSISELCSDHNPIMLNFFLQYSIPKYTGKLKTNWKKFKDTLKNSEFINPHFVNTAEHLDSIVCRLEDEIINAKISTANPIKENYIYHESKLRELNSERNLARKMFQTYRGPVLKRKLNKLNKQIKNLDQKIETDAFTNELLNVNATDGTVWKFVTPFKKKTKNIPSLNGLGGIANTDLEKANFLAESLETQFTLNNIANLDTEELVADSVMHFRTEANSVCKDFDSPLPSEGLDCIKSLRINK
ncbi:hypothetical protein AVEN_86122-1 [Araneus ventricosus]|uniref:Endonuclease/exonuclease/phosphatase domain-containing protein n=1 Tax=Araneus ventricosus TaxID=182803 RepID=A0A4Y2TRX5_ARAVE|nr:hypothetical protein AVEN_86122-1 [Araneus ventricosus]